MAVVIDQIDVETTESAAAPPAPGGITAQPQPLNPEEMFLVLRRRDDRAARLWAD